MATGSCFCGKVRISSSGEPAMKVVCHCLDCRKISGSTYSTNAVVPEDGFKLEQGSPKSFATTADSGKPITSYFCGDCGSTLWRDGASFPGMKIIKVGVMDDLNALDETKPGIELFAKHRVGWVPEMQGADQKQTMT